tara:strand:- start:58 stop:504 length:447 start_codon:yes stop_codon:yes gene_type:complete
MTTSRSEFEKEEDMPKKYMNDYQRVQAGIWLENQKTWIATDPSIQTIATQATKELGHRVTSTFVKSYLAETDWFDEIRKKIDPVPTAALQQAVALTLEALDLVIFSEANPDEIRKTITKARSMIGTTETPKQKEPAGLLDDLMKGGHA